MKVNSRLLLAFLEPLFIFQSRNSLAPTDACVELVNDSASLVATITGVSGGIKKQFTGASSYTMPFQLLIPIEVLHRTLKLIPDTEITLEQHGNNLHINSDTAHYQIGGEQYEAKRFETADEGTEFSAAEFLTAIEKVLPICSSDELRPALCGVYFDATNKKQITTVTTDGHRIAWYDTSLKLDKSFILHRESAKLIMETLRALSEVKVKIEARRIHFLGEDTTFYGVLIEEQYPAWRSVLPTFEKPIECNIEAGRLLGALKRLTLYATHDTQRILFHINGQSLQLQSSNLDYDKEASETLSMDHQGEDLSIAFNGPKVREMIALLDVADTDTVSLKLKKSNQGAYITASESNNFSSYLMPLHFG